MPDEDWLAIDAIVIPLVALGVLVLLTWGRRLLGAGVLIALGIASATLWLRYLGVPIIAPDNAGSFGVGAWPGWPVVCSSSLPGCSCGAVRRPATGRRPASLRRPASRRRRRP